MLYLRFLAQNNEITPYRVIASAIEKGKYKPKEFDLVNRLHEPDHRPGAARG